MNFDFYKKCLLEPMSDTVREMVLSKAMHDPNISFQEFMRLQAVGCPELV